MNNRIYVATFSEGAIEAIRDNNLNIELNHVCISEMLDEVNVENTLSEMKRDIRESQADHVIVHGPFTEICPASIDHLAVDIGILRLNQAYEVCKRLGVNRMVVHTGFLPFIYYPEWHLEKSIDFWNRFLEDKDEDFHLIIENVFEDNPYMMTELLEKLNDKRAEICFDIGHANAVNKSGKSICEWIEIMGHYISHFHLHNNDGSADQHGGFAKGTMDMREVLKTIDGFCNPNTTMTIEGRKCKDSIIWLKERGYII